VNVCEPPAVVMLADAGVSVIIGETVTVQVFSCVLER
jgi:hypothetical protein